MSDQRIECVDCGRVFTWTEGEQQFYRERGLSPPKRCPDCRRRKRSVVQGSAFDRPATRYGFPLFGLALALGLGLWWIVRGLTPMRAWLVAINVVSFCTFAYDKLTAQLDAERVPESILLAMSAAGGIAGALAGMVVFRHKVAKAEFKIRMLGVLILQVVVVATYALLIA